MSEENPPQIDSLTMDKPAEQEQEKEKLILPRVESASKTKTNQVGFVEEIDVTTNA